MFLEHLPRCLPQRLLSDVLNRALGFYLVTLFIIVIVESIGNNRTNNPLGKCMFNMIDKKTPI